MESTSLPSSIPYGPSPPPSFFLVPSKWRDAAFQLSFFLLLIFQLLRFFFLFSLFWLVAAIWNAGLSIQPGRWAVFFSFPFPCRGTRQKRPSSGIGRRVFSPLSFSSPFPTGLPVERSTAPISSPPFLSSQHFLRCVSSPLFSPPCSPHVRKMGKASSRLRGFPSTILPFFSPWSCTQK